MTLDEAIQHCEITAKNNEKLAEFYYKDSGKNQKSGDACQECAAEHRQLAEWLRDYKQLKEQEPCEDAISRQAALDLCDKKTRYDILYEYYEGKKYVRGWNEGKIINFTQLMQLPSVIPQSKIGHCKDCKWWKDSDGSYRRGVHAESQCPINRREVFEGNGYCYMFEPQESENKE